MRVETVMSAPGITCRVDSTCAEVARVMWERDCGFLPVVDGERVVGVVTDRDVAMAAYTRGERLEQIPVTVPMARVVHAVRPDDAIEVAEATLRAAQIRRLPVLDEAGRLLGVVTLGDLLRARDVGGDALLLDILSPRSPPRALPSSVAEPVVAMEPLLPGLGARGRKDGLDVPWSRPRRRALLGR